jgi:hypothetical protein
VKVKISLKLDLLWFDSASLMRNSSRQGERLSALLSLKAEPGSLNYPSTEPAAAQFDEIRDDNLNWKQLELTS